MALLEFHCDSCKFKFEQITSEGDPDRGRCPKCQKMETRRLISRFAVGGQGDLRESTVHGCHDAHVSLDSGGGGGCGSGGCGHNHGGGSAG